MCYLKGYLLVPPSIWSFLSSWGFHMAFFTLVEGACVIMVVGGFLVKRGFMPFSWNVLSWIPCLWTLLPFPLPSVGEWCWHLLMESYSLSVCLTLRLLGFYWFSTLVCGGLAFAFARINWLCLEHVVCFFLFHSSYGGGSVPYEGGGLLHERGLS